MLRKPLGNYIYVANGKHAQRNDFIKVFCHEISGNGIFTHLEYTTHNYCLLIKPKSPFRWNVTKTTARRSLLSAIPYCSNLTLKIDNDLSWDLLTRQHERIDLICSYLIDPKYRYSAPTWLLRIPQQCCVKSVMAAFVPQGNHVHHCYCTTSGTWRTILILWDAICDQLTGQIEDIDAFVATF